ncbi:MAG TPA: patatin-like phospholipase family protein [Tepidimicrobium sp.]|nr:patatin-like phospholipase family protein [Tepidimicrobium sp.]
MYGLVLEGGGARGAYHIGAYKALLEEGIQVKGVSGTSVGALNGAMIVQGDFEKAYEIWSDMSYSRVIDPSNEYIFQLGKQGKLDREDIKLIAEKLKGVITDKGLDITPLKDLIEDILDEERIRNSGKDFGIVTVSLTDMKPLEVYIEDIPHGKLRDYLLASAYLPVFRREKIDGKSYIDGSFYNNLPVNLLKDKGYKDLILIRTRAAGVIRRVDLKGLNAIIISPRESLGSILDFDGDRARYNLKLGYFDALKALRSLKGHDYYIEADKDENYFMEYLLSLDKARILKLAKLFRIEGESNRRMLFERVIPKLSNLLGVDDEDDYSDLFYVLLEELAKLYNIERFNVYTWHELLQLVKEGLKSGGDSEEEERIIDRIIEKVDILHIFTKEEVVKEFGNILFVER